MAGEIVDPTEYAAFREEWRKHTMVLHKPQFDYLAAKYLHSYPEGGSAAFRQADNTRGVLINWDLFQKDLGQDFTGVIDVEIEHEVFEMYQTRDWPLDRPYDPHSPAHYEAIRHAMRFAKSTGSLEKYMLFKRTMLELYEKRGDTFAPQELKFYEDYYQGLGY